MKYCTRCAYPENHPYGIIFDESGVCSGCRIHEEKDSINWDERFLKLKNIVNLNSEKMGRKSFDCIVPVTGGADSYFIVHTVKNVLGMNPLLVHYNPHYNTQVGIRNLANLATVFDCDMVTSTLSPNLLKKITRHTLKRYGNIYWQVLAGNLTFPVQVAVKYHIPLIIWGVQPWSEQTGMFSHLDEAEMTERCRKEHGLLGIAAEDLLTPDSGLTRADVQPFIYPYDNELEGVGVRGLYLSNYIRWDSKTQHEQMIRLYGYETAEQQRTFNSYEDVHCFHSAGLHDYLKYLKLGYSKVTDHVCREIRLKRMTRETGIDLIKKYTDKKPTDLPLFLNWLEMSESEFWSYAGKVRDPQAWQEQASGEWTLKDSITNHINDPMVNSVRLSSTESWSYKLTGSTEPERKDDHYLLMGRGYIDKLNFGALEPKSPNAQQLPKEWTPKPLIEVSLK